MTSPVLRRERGSNAPDLSGAYELGDGWSQKRVSLLEQKAEVKQEILERVAAVLQVPVEAIRSFDQETAFNNLRHHYDRSELNAAPPAGFILTFDPLAKWMAAMEENEKLYERLLKSEQQKVEMLQKLLDLTF